MQEVMETIFDVAYLITVFSLGIKMQMVSKTNRTSKSLGRMAIILGGGDSFHLIPRIYALVTDGLDNHVVALGIGKLVTSVTMTIFYLQLFYIVRERYHLEKRKILTVTVWLLTISRIVLCLFPQNGWTLADPDSNWGIIRNIPFVALGILMILLLYRQARATKDKNFRYMWLAILLSFGCYIPVVLWVGKIPMLGMLMIPKTCAYVWMIWMGYQETQSIKVGDEAGKITDEHIVSWNE